MRLGKTTLAHFLSQIVVSVSGFVATLIIARMLGPAVLGQYSVAVALGYFWLAIPATAVAHAITKRVSEGENKAGYLSAGLVLNLVVMVVLAGAVLLFEGLVNGYVGADVGYLMALLLGASILFRTVSAGLNGQKKVGLVGGLTALERLGRTGAQVGLILLGFGLAGLISGHVLSLVVLGLLGVYFYDVGLTLPRRADFQDVVSYARYAWLGSLKSRVFGWMDTLVLALFVSSSLIGIYEVAWGIASLLGMVSGSIRTTLFPEISELSAGDRYETIHHYLNEGLVFAGIFVIPGLFGGAVVGADLLQIYRPEFQQGYVVLLLLVCAYLWEVYGSQFISAINAVDRPDVAFRVNFVFVSINVVLNFLLVFYFGWYGAAVATLVSTFVWMFLGYWSLSRIIGRPSVPVVDIGYEVLAGLSMASFIYGLDIFVPDDHVTTVILVFVGAFVYVGVLVLLSRRIRRKSLSLVREFLPAG